MQSDFADCGLELVNVGDNTDPELPTVSVLPLHHATFYKCVLMIA